MNETVTLTPPEFPAPVAEQKAADLVPLDPGLNQRVDAQVESFIQGLLSTDIHGEDFKKRMDSAFKLGRKEITEATRLNSSFLKQNYRGIEASPAYQAMARLRDIMDELDPGKHGDLFGTSRILGIIPGSSKLKAYLRKYESAENQINKLIAQLSAAQDDLERDVVALDEAKVQLWAAMQNLKAAAHFAEKMQAELKEHVERLKTSDPLRAKALEQEALYYAAQNLEGILTQQAVTVNGYLALDPLKKTARELSIGIDRLKTTGMSALSIAQMVAIATGNQQRTQEAVSKTREVVGNLVVQTSVQLGQHAQTVAKAAADPMIEIAKLQAMFDNTFKAIDAMDNFRSVAIGNMMKNNETLQALIEKSKPYLERAASGAAASKLDPGLAGPVAL